jgi:hypothetical protein
MATPISWPLNSYPGERPQEAAGRLINCFSEPLPQGGAGANVIYRAPGITEFATSSESGFRGITVMSSILYVAFEDTLMSCTSGGGALAPVGTGVCSGTEPVFFARNNAPSPDQVIVTENGAFTFTSATAPAAYVDPDLPQPIDVTFGLGFFFFGIANGRVFASGLNSTSINPLDFITAEGKPDALRRVIWFGDKLYVMGHDSIELWGSPINASGFPLNRITVIPRGLAGARCVSGYENGFDLGIVFVGNDNKVYILNGYTPQAISNHTVERDISAITDKSTIEMSCYSIGGHVCIRIRSADWTWVHDFVQQRWHERKSYLVETSRSMATVFAFGKWICGDTDSGDLGSIVEGTYTEWGEPLVWQVESQPTPSFPIPINIRSARFLFTTAVGDATGIDPIQTDPTVQISWTDDGGVTWGIPLLRKLGRQSTPAIVTVNRTGTTNAYGRRWRLVIADPVHAALMGGDMDIQARSPA